MSSSPSPSFWQEIVLQAFRVPIRLAYALGSPSLKDLQKLMKAALVQELRAQGHTIREISVALGCSEYWASRLVKAAKNVGEGSGDGSILARMVNRLREGPASRPELMELLPHGAKFRADRVALAVLVRAGIAEPVHGRSRRYRLTPHFEGLSDEGSARPLKEAERSHIAATAIIRALYDKGPLDRIGLRGLVGRAKSNRQLDGGLEALHSQGLITCLEGEGGKLRYDLAANHLKFVPTDRAERVRTGLMSMFDGIGLSTEWALNTTEGDPLGQRTLRFRARPKDLHGFIRAHHTATMAQIHALDEAAEGDAEGVDCSMVWIVVGRG